MITPANSKCDAVSAQVMTSRDNCDGSISGRRVAVCASNGRCRVPRELVLSQLCPPNTQRRRRLSACKPVNLMRGRHTDSVSHAVLLHTTSASIGVSSRQGQTTIGREALLDRGRASGNGASTAGGVTGLAPGRDSAPAREIEFVWGWRSRMEKVCQCQCQLSLLLGRANQPSVSVRERDVAASESHGAVSWLPTSPSPPREQRVRTAWRGRSHDLAFHFYSEHEDALHRYMHMGYLIGKDLPLHTPCPAAAEPCNFAECSIPPLLEAAMPITSLER